MSRGEIIWFGFLMTIIASMIMGAAIAANRVQAESPQNVPPYRVAQYSDGIAYNTYQIFKTVHQGCEIYTFTGGGGEGMQMRLGRGCK